MSGQGRVANYPIGDDEAGMRLDRWFRRRFPEVSQAHLNKIVRKGEVRVSGKRAEISTRLEAGQSVRVPPLAAAGAPPAKGPPADPRDAEAIRAMILYEDADVLVLNKPYGLAVQGGSGQSATSTACWRRCATSAANVRRWFIGSTATPPACC